MCKDFGLIYSHVATTKPIVCSSQDSTDHLREGDIFYRYSGQTRRITSVDLHLIIENRVEDERKNWRDLLSRTARSTPSVTYLLDLSEGRAEGPERSFVISQELLNKKNLFMKAILRKKVNLH